jgi:hypothetical protein
MKINGTIVNYNLTIWRIICMLTATMAIIVVLSGSRGGTDVRVQKICDAKIKYCVEQNCKVPFDHLKSGVLSAYSFFEKLGYAGYHNVDIELTPEVSVVWGAGAYRTKIRVLGKYEEDERKIYLTCWGEKWLTGRNDYNLDMTPEFYETIVAHEMIHFLANRYSKEKVNGILSEYIAYSGQFELIPEETIRILVEKYHVEAFDENNIDELDYMEDPGKFGLKSFLHYSRTKGSLVKEIMAGSFKAPPRNWPPY